MGTDDTGLSNHGRGENQGIPPGEPSLPKRLRRDAGRDSPGRVQMGAEPLLPRYLHPAASGADSGMPNGRFL